MSASGGKVTASLMRNMEEAEFLNPNSETPLKIALMVSVC